MQPKFVYVDNVGGFIDCI